VILLILALLTTIASFIHLSNGGDVSVVLPLIFIWSLTAIALIPPLRPIKTRLIVPFRFLRAHPTFYWLLLLIYSLVAIGAWFKNYQPVWGKTPNADEVAYLFAAAWLWWFLAAFGTQTGDGRQMGAKLGKSRATGGLITLTTIGLLLIGVESYMRAFMIISDTFAFTAMHYWWTQIYWKPINSLGYRDYEPNSDPTQQHILVVGDSFPSGHGVNHIDDTFPHVLDRSLDGYSVNIAAQPGWDTNVEFAPLQNYPVTPNVVILSHYFNDLGYLMTQNPVRVTFPEEPVQTVVRDWFIPNFLYWHVFQFGIEGHGGEYIDLVLDAYNDPNVWAQHEANLAQFITWSRENDARLIVIVFPALNAIEASSAATTRVADYFTSQGVTVVNMEDALIGRPTAELITNPFDAHPNVATHALAAQLLADAVSNP
jgi:hypothetical protein